MPSKYRDTNTRDTRATLALVCDPRVYLFSGGSGNIVVQVDYVVPLT